MADYDDGCRGKSRSTKCPTKKSRTSSSLPISRRENASGSRRHSRQSSKSLAKTCKSGSHKPVAPRSRIHGCLRPSKVFGPNRTNMFHVKHVCKGCPVATAPSHVGLRPDHFCARG